MEDEAAWRPAPAGAGAGAGAGPLPVAHRLPCKVAAPAATHAGAGARFARLTEVLGAAEARAVGAGAAGGGAGPEVRRAHFRGRQLVGARLGLPEGYAGFLVAKDGADWVVGELGEVVHWNHDKAPQANDHLPRACEWLALAPEVHAPVAPEAVDAMLREAGGGGTEC